MSADLTGKRIAILATDGVEGIELTSPRDALEQAGATVELLAPQDGAIQLWDHAEKGGTLPVDRTVSEADPQQYDGLVLPGGVRNADHLRIDAPSVRFVTALVRRGVPVGVICHGAWILIEARAVERPHAHLVPVAPDRPAERGRAAGSTRRCTTTTGWSRAGARTTSRRSTPGSSRSSPRACTRAGRPDTAARRSLCFARTRDAQAGGRREHLPHGELPLREAPVTEQDVFILADQALKAVVEQIRDDQWDLVVPDDMTRKPGVTLRELINYHAYDDAWVPDVLAGRTIEEVGDKYAGDLLGDHPKLNFASIVETAVLAVRAFDDPDRTVHLSYGDWPAREYLKHITSFRGLRTYDIAKLIGADTTLPPDLVQGLWDEIAPSAEEWRKLGVYGPAVAVPEDAPLQDRLLGLTGRQPA